MEINANRKGVVDMTALAQRAQAVKGLEDAADARDAAKASGVSPEELQGHQDRVDNAMSEAMDVHGNDVGALQGTRAYIETLRAQGKIAPRKGA
jgi:hypothetical protein